MKIISKYIVTTLIAGIVITTLAGQYYLKHGFLGLRLPDLPISLFIPCIDNPCQCDWIGLPGFDNHFGPWC